MTKREVHRIVRQLRRVMSLEHWDILIDWDRPASPGADATSWRANCYDTATLRFSTDWRERSPFEMRALVAHELGHLLTRDLDQSVQAVKDELEGAEWNLYYDRYLHESEGVVDRYARIIAGLTA